MLDTQSTNWQPRGMKARVIYGDSFGLKVRVFDFPITNDLMAEGDQEVLEHIFRQCNAVDGTEWISQPEQRALKLRSMSVGDLVVLPTRRLYLCKPQGWELVTDFN